MKTQLPSYLLCLALLAGCDVFHLGSDRAPQLPDLDQMTARGTVMLFKAELDNNNIAAATRILARDSGVPYLAIEKYEMQNEIARLGRRLANRAITALSIDTLSTEKYKLHTEFSWIKEVTFTTVRMDGLWYIISIDE